MSAMENATRNGIAEQAYKLSNTSELPHWIEAIDSHLQTGETQYFYLKDEAALVEFTQLVGHDAITSDQIVAYQYEATANESLEESGMSIKFDGTVTVGQLHAWMGDFGINLEFPNSFKTWVAVALDKETIVIYDHETISWGVVCEDCVNSDDPKIQEELELNEHTGYGCGHVDDEYRFKNTAFMMKRESQGKIAEEALNLLGF
jgi:hypothetical protein